MMGGGCCDNNLIHRKRSPFPFKGEGLSEYEKDGV